MNKVEKIIHLQQDLAGLLENNKSNVSQVQDEFLNKLVEVLEASEGIFKGRKKEKAGTYKEIEDYQYEVLKRYEKLYNKTSHLKNVDELLDLFVEKIKEELSVNSIKLSFDIYPAETKTTIQQGNGSFDKKESKSVEKFKTFLQIIVNKGIHISDLVVLEETINSKRMRKFPYKIIYLNKGEISKTILISDEIGQATYVYDGIIKVENFRFYTKSEPIEGLAGKKIIYSNDNYSDRLCEAIFWIPEAKSENILQEPNVKGKDLREIMDVRIEKLNRKVWIQQLYTTGKLQENVLTIRKWKNFAKEFNEKYAKEFGYQLPISWDGLILALNGKRSISTTKEYVICLLEDREFEKIPTVSKVQLQELYKGDRIPQDEIAWNKWKKFAEEFNEKNTKGLGYQLPTSWNGLIPTLGGEKSISTTKEYVICLLEDREFEEIPTVSKAELQELYKGNKIPQDKIALHKWRNFAKEFNEKNTKGLGFHLPTSWDGLISTLGGEKSISTTKEYVMCLLEDRKFEEIPTVSKAQLQELYKGNKIPQDEITHHKWKKFAEEFNEEKAKELGYQLPTSRDGLIPTLGGEKSISTTKEYIMCLLEDREFEKILTVSKAQLQELYKGNIISQDEIAWHKWKNFSKEFNDENTKKLGYQLPTSWDGLISALGGEKSTSMSKEYVISLLEDREF